MPVEITRNETDHNQVWRAARDMLEGWISRCHEVSDHSSETWKLTPLRGVRMSPGSRWKCRHFDREKLMLHIRTGGNDSAWEYVVVPPKTLPTMVVGRVATLWNGWDGHNVPDAYAASQPLEEELKSQAKGKRVPKIVEPKRPEPVIVAGPIFTAPVGKIEEVKPVESANENTLLALVDTIRLNLAKAESIKAEIAQKIKDRDALMSEADVLLTKATAMDAEISRLSKELDSPQVKQSLDAAKAFAGLLQASPAK